MALLKLKAAPFVLIEDNFAVNNIPLLLELSQYEKDTINFFTYDQPISIWSQVFKHNSKLVLHDEFDPEMFIKYTKSKCTVVIDSINQMTLYLGWSITLQCLQKLRRNPNVNQLIVILHNDCLLNSSKLQSNLNHIASAIVSYHTNDQQKVSIQLKKGGKLFRSEEILSYDVRTNNLKSTSIVNESKETVVEQPSPANLSTFRIEIGQEEQIQRNKLKLPYMSKINEGQSQVFYEPDAVDDWDEEDPDEDLDI